MTYKGVKLFSFTLTKNDLALTDNSQWTMPFTTHLVLLTDNAIYRHVPVCRGGRKHMSIRDPLRVRLHSSVKMNETYIYILT